MTTESSAESNSSFDESDGDGPSNLSLSTAQESYG